MKYARDLNPGDIIKLKGVVTEVESKQNYGGGQTVIYHTYGRIVRSPYTEMLILPRADDVISAVEDAIDS